ncbi:MAG: MFS transporter [Flavobacteriaceae bacterium]
MKSKKQNRIALSLLFFLSGFSFSSWAARIPTLKTTFEMNEAELGSFLFILPVCSLIGLPLSAWFIAKYESRYLLLSGFFIFFIGLLGIGYAPNLTLLSVTVCFFAFGLRAINISINTQAIQLQKRYGKTINGSFHGIWSFGGLCGILFATLMIYYEVTMSLHLLSVVSFGLLCCLFAAPYLLTNDLETAGNKLILGKPDKFIFYTGLVVFCAAVCEGGIYDWSSVYFKEVVQAELFTLSYLSFMIAMTISRFFTDLLIQKIGMKRLFMVSASTVIVGISILILTPTFYLALVGFFISGLGVASIFPMSFNLAGYSKKYAPGVAISIVGTYATVGVLLAPPFVGYIAHLFSLNLAFLIFIVAALLLIIFSRKAYTFL